MKTEDLRKVTLEEYIEANHGLEDFLRDLLAFGKDNGFDWERPVEDMQIDMDRRRRFFQRMQLM